MVNFIKMTHNEIKNISAAEKFILYYWFAKNSIDVNLITLDQAISWREKNFIYALYPKEPWNVSEHIKESTFEIFSDIFKS